MVEILEQTTPKFNTEIGLKLPYITLQELCMIFTVKVANK